VSACEAWKHDPRSTNVLCCAAHVLVIDADVVRGCHGCHHHLHTLCVMVVGAAHRVTVVVFAHVAWGHGHGRCGAFVAVAVFMPCMLWWWVWHMVVGAAHGVTVAVFVHVAWGCSCGQYGTCVVVAVFVPCVLWSRAGHQVMVVVFMCIVWGCCHC
jgi:hypothetical protein